MFVLHVPSENWIFSFWKLAIFLLCEMNRAVVPIYEKKWKKKRNVIRKIEGDYYYFKLNRIPYVECKHDILVVESFCLNDRCSINECWYKKRFFLNFFFIILSKLFGKNRFYLWHPTNKLKFYAHCSHMEHQLSPLRCFKQEMDKSAKNHERKMSFHTPHKCLKKTSSKSNTSQRTNNGNMLHFQKHFSVSYVWIAYKKMRRSVYGFFSAILCHFFFCFVSSILFGNLPFMHTLFSF